MHKLIVATVAALALAAPAHADNPAAVTGYTTDLAPAATAAAANRTTAWGKAQAIRNLVRASIPPRVDFTCADLAHVFAILARQNGLRTRLLVGSVNLLNGYDTHTTSEVWLPGYGKWVLADATLGGHFTVQGVPAGAYDLQRQLEAGRSATFHRAPIRHAARARDAYINPLLYFRNIIVYDDAFMLGAMPAWSSPLVDGRPWYAGRLLSAHASAVFDRFTSVVVVARSMSPPSMLSADADCVASWNGRGCGPYAFVEVEAGVWVSPIVSLRSVRVVGASSVKVYEATPF